MKKTVSITLDEITYEKMESIRKEQRKSRSEYIKDALRMAEATYNVYLEHEQWRLK